MDHAEAARILEVKPSASREQIGARYRYLMRVNHPDLNGSAYISLKVTDAKDLLMPSAPSDPAWQIKEEELQKRRAKRAAERAAKATGKKPEEAESTAKNQ